MWFNNVLVYRYELSDEIDIVAHLETEKLKGCPPHARFVFGWMPIFADELIHEVAGSLMVCLGKEERILPRAVVNQYLAERVSLLETQQGRTVKRAEKAQMAEDLEFELLPKSFCVQKRLFAILDKSNQCLIVNTASDSQSEQLTSLLRKSLPGLSLEPLFYSDALAVLFAEWIVNPETLPKGFQLASDCLLFSPDDDKKRVTCKGYELPSEEILTLLSQGLLVSELSLIWDERIQFTLTKDLTFKRLKPLEYLVDQFNDLRSAEEESMQRDAELMLLSSELRGLVKALMTGLQVTAKKAAVLEAAEA